MGRPNKSIQKKPKTRKKEMDMIARVVSQSVMTPVTIFRRIRQPKPKLGSDSEKNFKDGLAALSIPDEISPFLRRYAERYHKLLKSEPDNHLTIYNTVCFLLLSLLDTKLDEKMCSFLDYLTPIVDIKTHMARFDDSIGMAMQVNRDLAAILKYWQLGALRHYEFLKWQLITIRSAELLLLFQADQSNGYVFYLGRAKERALRDPAAFAQRLHGFDDINRIQRNKDTFSVPLDPPNITVTLLMNRNTTSLPLDEATAIITTKKRSLETRIENFALYLRCIRELIHINENNLAKIHSYQFRWRPVRISERVKGQDILVNPIFSELHKAFIERDGNK